MGKLGVTDDITSREDRIRKKAELQSLYATLANLRGREASYIEDSAAIPDVLFNQINEARRDIERVETALFVPTDKTSEGRSRSSYRQAFEAEVAGDFSKAIKQYRSAGRYGHPDGSAAVRSLRYLMRAAKRKSTPQIQMPISGSRSRNRLLIALAGLLLLVLIAAFVLNGRSSLAPQESGAVAPTATTALSPEVQVIVAATATPPAIDTPTSTPIPTTPPQPIPTEILPTETPTTTATTSFTLMSAPKIIDPKDGLVWGDGAIVFEFERLNLAYDELYCLDTMRGYNLKNAENWSHEPRGNKQPYIAVEPNVFRVAKAQGVSCIVWSAYIAKGSCEYPISESTEKRVIGLPRPCDFK